MNLNPPAFLGQTLTDNSNAELTFALDTADSLSFDAWGNPTLSSTETTYSAIIHQKDVTESNELLEGVDLRWLPVRGRLTNPKTFDGAIAHLTEGSIVFNDGRTGKIKLQLPIANPYQGVVEVLGEEFEGYVLLGGF